ncbi:hypothetical protein SAMN05216174_102287 [Actinokineospora iranica]|uniref:Uncharacterized protein n=1 Tax=Actinokineospora iranica TaxID=1271860 RepID=A0A1G6LY62_9PSEU|nr:hypothetical protein SAMN05216174_102287 [Actinokineospora iranica]
MRLRAVTMTAALLCAVPTPTAGAESPSDEPTGHTVTLITGDRVLVPEGAEPAVMPWVGRTSPPPHTSIGAHAPGTTPMRLSSAASPAGRRADVSIGRATRQGELTEYLTRRTFSGPRSCSWPSPPAVPA